MKRLFTVLLCVVLLLEPAALRAAPQAGREESGQEESGGTDSGETAATDGPQVGAPSVFLAEASTGKMVYEKNADERRPPASVTKVMTLLLIFDALAEGRTALTDQVTVSEYAASMGGSQVFLEPGEVQTVDTLLKCIAVASANDACVAMAEHIWGSEEEFVRHMNERAEGLGMENTTFVNCNGLDAEGHLTTARDIGTMSRELIRTYPQVRDYACIWMEDITHTTARGSTTFTLANTNKLVRQYAGATGLKTGSTDDAGFCVTATAEKNQMEMIAVVMGAETSKQRFQDAASLLDYGFGKCVKYVDEGIQRLEPVKVRGGQKRQTDVRQKEPFQYVDTEGADLTAIEKEYQVEEELKAPVRAGDKAGSVVYTLDGAEIGRADIVAAENVPGATLLSSLEQTLAMFFPA